MLYLYDVGLAAAIRSLPRVILLSIGISLHRAILYIYYSDIRLWKQFTTRIAAAYGYVPFSE